MIRINLIPIEELESQYWYAPDLAMLAACVITAWLGMQYYTGLIQADIDSAAKERDSYNQSFEKIQGDLTRFKDLDSKVSLLRNKLTALQKITTSKLTRFKPLIILEHLQNLKPDGIWFSMIEIKGEANTVAVKGKAFDNLLVAEFITALNSTSTQDTTDSDLRTQVFFARSGLEKTEAKFLSESGQAKGPIDFSLNLVIDERRPPDVSPVQLSMTKTKT